jgi:hypothetical protein
MNRPPRANRLEIALGCFQRFFTTSKNNKAHASMPEGKSSSTSSELEWGDFWKQWVKVWSFLSFVLFQRLSNFPPDVGIWITQWLILPIGPAWAAFSLWRYRAMRLPMVLLDLVMTIAWCVAVLAALVFWLEPEARPLQFRAIAGALSAADLEWMMTHSEAWDVIQTDLPVVRGGPEDPRSNRSETFLQITVANRSAHPRPDINVDLTSSTRVRIRRAFVRLKPYSSVAPRIQQWIWRQFAEPQDNGGIPDGTCPKQIPQSAPWTWCKSTAVDRITLRMLEPRQSAILYLQTRFMTQKREMIDVRVGDLGQASVELVAGGGGGP